MADTLEKMVTEHRRLRGVIKTTRDKMDALEIKMRPLQARASAQVKMKAAGMSAEEIATVSNAVPEQ